MAEGIKRREFIKSVSLAGASLAIPDGVPAFNTNANDGISNAHFSVSFDRHTGTLNIRRSNGTPLLTGAHACANLSPLNAGTRRATVAETFRHVVKRNSFSDPLGSGKKLTITSRDSGKQTDFITEVLLYAGLPAISLAVTCKNVSQQDLVIHSLEPLRAIQSEGGALNIPGVSKCLTNGQMYFDAGRIHAFGSKEGAITSGVQKGVRLANGLIPGTNETIHSWWNAGFFSGYDKEGVAIGYLENSLALGNLLISRAGTDRVSLIAESVYPPGLTLKPGKSINSNPVLITVAPTPYGALEDYAAAIGKFGNARVSSVINGWCSWFYTLAQVSEAEVMAQTKFAARHLKPYGLEYIQVDEGYQKWHGDWEGNERFPHGMKWLADEIKRHGFRAGIWISPYVVSEPSAVVQQHPEWLLKNPDGTPQRVGNWPQGAEPPADENPKRYGLDITHPGAAQWLHDLIHTIAHDWGYEMIKIDFVAWSILAAKQYHDPALSAAQVYRRGMEIMRKAAGDKCHILECGPGATTVGLIDSMRIELDVNYGFSAAAWDTFFLHPASSMSALGKRFYFHKKTWVNDVDHVCIHLLNNPQSEAVVTLIAMSGGNTMSGDRLTQLDPYKLELLKKITPSYGETAVPVDLFDNDLQSTFALRVKKTFGEWMVVSFFNAKLTETIERKFPVQRFGLDARKEYLVFDFWKQEFIGEVSGTLGATIQPGSVRLLSVHEKSGNPQVISTDRHITQGGVELEDVLWDEAQTTISGVSTGPADTSHNVYVYVPGDHPWTWGGYVLFRDYEGYSLKLVHSNVIQVNVKFGPDGKVKWSIDVKEFFR